MKKILLSFLLSLSFIFSVNAAPCPSAGTFNTNALIPVSGFQNRLVGYGANNRGCDGDTAIFFTDIQVKAAASLSNVDNTSDLNKPISTATQAALDTKLNNTLNQNRIFVGNSSNIATGVAMSGDITINDSGVTSIGALKVTNGMLEGNIFPNKLSLTSGYILLGNGSNVGSGVAMLGDIAIDSSGVTTIQPNTVSDSKLRESVGLSVIGRSANSTGNVADITAALDGQTLRRSGTSIGFGALNLASANSITGILPNSNTTATSAATVSSIVARDSSGDFLTNGIFLDDYLYFGQESVDNSFRLRKSGDDLLLEARFGGSWQGGTLANEFGEIQASYATSSDNALNIGFGSISTNATFYPAFFSSTGPGFGSPNVNSSLNFNPSTGVLSATSFTGAGTGLTGTAASLTAGIASTVSTANEASDTTTFPLFVTASGAQTLEPKNNTNFRYNTSSNLLAVNLATIDNGGASLSTAINGLTFGNMGAGSYIGYGSTQFPRSTGVSSTGSLYHARNAFYNPVITDFSYGISGGGVTLLDLADTAINFKYAPSGTVGNPVTFTTGLSISQSTGITTARSLTVDNGGSALTGTTALINTPNTLGDGNYYNFGTSGRNMGVYTGGNLFLTANLDYNTTSNAYIYNSSAGASAIELGQTGGALRYAVSGTAGNTATVLDALTWSNSTGDVTVPNGNVAISTVGKGLQVKTGSNSRLITGTLSGGALAVPNTSLTANTQIFCYPQNPGGTPGFLRTTNRVNGSGFTVTSSSGSDTSAVACLLVEAI